MTRGDNITFQSNSLNGMSVRQGLDRENAETLRWFARLLGADKKVIRKPEQIILTAKNLMGDRLRELWSRLDRIQQAAIAETIYATNLKFDAARFRIKYGQLPSLGSERYYYYANSKEGPTLARLLLHPHGMPGERATRLKEFVPKPAPAQLKTSMTELDHESKIGSNNQADEESDVAVISEMEQAAQRDLKLVLRVIREGKVRVGDKSGLPTAASMKMLEGVLSGGDFYSPTERDKLIDKDEDQVGPIKSFAWPLLLQAAKLAVKEGTRLKLTTAGEKALAGAAHKTISLIWKRWITCNAFDELRRIDVIKGQQGKGRATLTSVSTRREAVSRALHNCPIGEWIEVDEFFRFMRASDYYFEVSRDPWDLYIVASHYGSLGYEGFHDWEILQGRYVLCLLFEYGATLGIIDVGYDSPVDARDDFRKLWGSDDLSFFSRYDGLIRFRLTPLGAYCLGACTEYSPRPLTLKASFTVMPSLRLIVNGELSPDERTMLELIAECVAETEWSFSNVRTLKAVEASHDVAAIVEFLQARDDQPLPDMVVGFFRDAAERAGAIKDRGDAKLVECTDTTLADTIANAEVTKAYCLRAGERHLVVPSNREQSFRKGLERLGYVLSF